MSDRNPTLHPDEQLRLGDLGGTLKKVGLGVAVLGHAVAVIFGVIEGDEMRRFFHSYLMALVYFFSIALGALFFVVLQHLVKAKWSVVIRRIAEILSSTFPILGVALAVGIVLPMLFGMDSLFLWAGEIPADDHLLHAKHGWLNVPFFAVRMVIYVVALVGISRYFFRKSVEQDESGDPAISDRLRVRAAPAIITFAFVIAFMAFDLLMSLDPYWYSTIFGVYFFAGSAISIFATLALVSMWLQSRRRLVHSITIEHYHDVGKLLFAFIFFWAYIGFSQFMLIWYADLPEETRFFDVRMYTSWKGLSWVLLFGHWAFPYLFLLSRWTKRNKASLAFFSVWMLVMHYLDIFWLVMPNFDPTGFTIGVSDIAALLGVAGLFIFYAAREAEKVNLIPVKDPRLGGSLTFENY